LHATGAESGLQPMKARDRSGMSSNWVAQVTADYCLAHRLGI
jgi:hypothetical protein